MKLKRWRLDESRTLDRINTKSAFNSSPSHDPRAHDTPDDLCGPLNLPVDNQWFADQRNSTGSAAFSRNYSLAFHWILFYWISTAGLVGSVVRQLEQKEVFFEQLERFHEKRWYSLALNMRMVLLNLSVEKRSSCLSLNASTTIGDRPRHHSDSPPSIFYWNGWEQKLWPELSRPLIASSQATYLLLTIFCNAFHFKLNHYRPLLRSKLILSPDLPSHRMRSLLKELERCYAATRSWIDDSVPSDRELSSRSCGYYHCGLSYELSPCAEEVTKFT